MERSFGREMDEKEVLPRLQATELEILRVFADYCERRGLSWFIDGGTALGARRHGGFIPWDDDIDVGMLRHDYDRFLAFASHSFPVGYSVHTPDNTAGFAGMFTKIYKDGTCFDTAESLAAGVQQGIFIDVFPYDYLSSDLGEARRQRRRARFWQSVSYLYHSPVVFVPHSGFVGVLEKLVCHVAHAMFRLLFSPNDIIRHFNSARLDTENKNSDYVITFAWPEIDAIPATELLKLSSIEFEGERCPCPACIEKYLERMYGDWWVLPDQGDRKTHLPLHLKFGDGTEWYS